MRALVQHENTYIYTYAYIYIYICVKPINNCIYISVYIYICVVQPENMTTIEMFAWIDGDVGLTLQVSMYMYKYMLTYADVCYMYMDRRRCGLDATG
jgi:hypothetical protein